MLKFPGTPIEDLLFCDDDVSDWEDSQNTSIETADISAYEPQARAVSRPDPVWLMYDPSSWSIEDYRLWRVFLDRSKILADVRARMVATIFRVAYQEGQQFSSAFAGIDMMDRYYNALLSRRPFYTVTREHMEITACVCFAVALKFEEDDPIGAPKVHWSRLLPKFGMHVDISKMTQREMHVCKMLDWKLRKPTSFDFMFANCANWQWPLVFRVFCVAMDGLCMCYEPKVLSQSIVEKGYIESIIKNIPGRVPPLAIAALDEFMAEPRANIACACACIL